MYAVSIWQLSDRWLTLTPSSSHSPGFEARAAGNGPRTGGAGAGGKMYGPATAEQAGCGKGKEYQVPEYFEHEPFSLYDLLKEINQLDKYQEQPVSGVSSYWSGRREI